MPVVTSPSGGSLSFGGTPLTVQWQSTEDATFYAVRLSLDGGATFTNVTAADLPGFARSFTFTLPAVSQPTLAVVRVAAKDEFGSQFAKGDSGPFTIAELVQLPTNVLILAPNGGLFQAGQPLMVQWDTQGPVSTHAVRLSLDGGVTFTNVSGADLPGAARSCTFALPSPPQPSVPAVVRVVARDAAGTQVARGDSAPFTLQQPLPVPTTVVVSAPNGGLFQAGQPVTVQWDTQGPVSSHAVRLSLDGGVTFTNVTGADLPAFARSFTLTLPSPPQPSVTAIVRVAAKDAVGSQIAKGDSTPFTLQQQPQPMPTTVVVTAPTGGAFQAGQQLTVQWVTNGSVSAHAIRLSLDGGTTFSNVTAVDLPAAARSFTFALPSPPQPSVTAIVRVAAKDAAGSQIAKGDSTPFTLQQQPQPMPTTVVVTAPAGGAFQAGQQLTVQWVTNGPVSAHAVRLSLDGGATFADVSAADVPAGARSFTFALPSPPQPSVTAIVRVAAKDAGGSQIAKGDSTPFTLQQQPQPMPTTVVVTAPAGGAFQAGQQLTVQWDTQGPASAHAVRLSLDGGTTFSNVTAVDLPAAARSFTFALPSPPQPSVAAVVRVVARDAGGSQVAKGDSPFFTVVQQPQPMPTTVVVTAPAGGAFQAGQQLTVQWDTQGPVSAHAVRLSLDGGATFSNLTAADLPGFARSFTFALPSPPQPSVTAIVRVVAKDAAGSQIAKGDSTPFTLQQQQPQPMPTIVVVTAPAGGAFQAGQQLTVQWVTNGPVSAHAIRLSLDGGTTFSNVTAVDLPAAARSFTFALPSPPQPSVTAIVRVAAKDAAGTQVAKGDSTPFTLQQQPPQPLEGQLVFEPEAPTAAAALGPFDDAISVIAGGAGSITGRFKLIIDGQRIDATVMPRTEKLPDGARSRFDPNPCQTFQKVTLTVDTDVTLAPRDYTFEVRGRALGLESTPKEIALKVAPAPSIGLSVEVITGTVNAGNPAKYQLRLKRPRVVSGAPVTFDVRRKDLPAGANATVDPPTTTGELATLTITTDVNTRPGRYRIEVGGTAPGALVKTAPLMLEVKPRATVVLVTKPPTEQKIDAGSTAEYTIGIQRPGLEGPLRLLVRPENLPRGVTASFDDDMPEFDEAKLRLKAAIDADGGSTIVKVEGDAGANTVTPTDVVLTVNEPPRLRILEVDPENLTVTKGEEARFLVRIERNFPDFVRLDVVVAPDGESGDPLETRVIDPKAADVGQIFVKTDDTNPATGYSVFITAVRDSDERVMSSQAVANFTVEEAAPQPAVTTGVRATPAERGIRAGQSGTFDLVVGGPRFGQPVSFTVTAPRPGIRSRLTRVAGKANAYTLTVNVGPMVPPGRYVLQLTGTAPKARITPLAVTVNVQPRAARKPPATPEQPAAN